MTRELPDGTEIRVGQSQEGSDVIVNENVF